MLHTPRINTIPFTCNFGHTKKAVADTAVIVTFFFVVALSICSPRWVALSVFKPPMGRSVRLKFPMDQLLPSGISNGLS